MKMLLLKLFSVQITLSIVSAGVSTTWSAYGGSYAHLGYKNESIGHPLNGFNQRWTQPYINSANLLITKHKELIFVTPQDPAYPWLMLAAANESTGIMTKNRTVNLPLDCQSPFLYLGPREETVLVLCWATQLLSFNATSFQQLWSIYLKESPSMSPETSIVSVHSTNYIYVSSSNQNDFVVTALNASTGDEIFEAHVKGSNDVSCQNFLLTTYNDSRLFFTSATVGELDPTNGQVKWILNNSDSSIKCPRSLTFWPVWNLVVGNGILVLVAPVRNDNHSMQLVAYDVSKSGQYPLRWTGRPCLLNDSLGDVTPAIDVVREIVYLTCSGQVQAFDLRNGTMIANYQNCIECGLQPLVINDHLFVRQTGSAKVVQVYHLGNVQGPIAKVGSTVQEWAYHNRTMFLPSKDGTITAFKLI